MKAAILVLLIAALIAMQVLVGGTRLLFSLPCYAVLALAGLLAVAVRHAPGARWPRACLFSTAVLTGYLLARARLSPVDYLWWPDFFEVLGCALVYSLVAGVLHRPREWRWLLGVLAFMALANVVVGMRQFTTPDNFMPAGLTRAAMGHRASGFYVSPNHYAGFLEVVGLLALAMACWSEVRGWVRGLLAYLAAACLAGVILSVSRGGYLSVAFALVIFGVISLWIVARLDRRRAMFLGVGGGVLALGAAAILLTIVTKNALVEARLTELDNQMHGAVLDGRIHNWEAAWQQSRVNPVFGTGAGTHLFYARIFRHPTIQSDPVHAHSDYLELLAEYGWLGAAAMVFFLVTHLGQGVRTLARAVREEVAGTGLLRHERVAWPIGLLVAASVMLCHSAVDFNLHIPANALVMAIIFGALAAPRIHQPAPPSARVSWPQMALPVLSLGILLMGLPKLPAELWGEKVRKAFVRSDLPEVLRLEDKAATNQRNPETYFYLGEANRSLGLLARPRSARLPFLVNAESRFRQALAIFPQDEITWVRLAQSLDAQGRFSEAETAYLTALQLDGNLGVLYAFYGQHLRLRGDQVGAREMVDKAKRLGNDSAHTIDALDWEKERRQTAN